MTPSPMSAPLCIEGLKKQYRVPALVRRKVIAALSGISFTVQTGQIFGFLGPNGAGKSTTIKIVTGLLQPTEGRVAIFGQSPNSRQARSSYGFLPENPAFPDHLTGEELLLFLGRLSGLRPPRLQKRVGELMELVRLTRARNLQVRKYSKGMVQRLGIAQAVLHDAPLVILDEPMSGLDPIGRREVRDLINHLRTQGKTVFFSTHIISDVEQTCDAVAILVGGRLVRAGSVRELIGSQVREYEVVATRVPDSPRVDGVAGTPAQTTFQVPNQTELQNVLTKLWASGAEIISVTPRRYSLEDVFLAEVRQSGTPETME